MSGLTFDQPTPNTPAPNGQPDPTRSAPLPEVDLQEGIPPNPDADPTTSGQTAAAPTDAERKVVELQAELARVHENADTAITQAGEVVAGLRAENAALNEQIVALKQQHETMTSGESQPPADDEEAPRRFATPEAEIDHLKGVADTKLAEAHGIIQRIEVLLHNRAPSAIFQTFHRAVEGMKGLLADI